MIAEHDFMKGLQRDEASKVVPLAPPEPANDTKPMPVQPKKWRRVTVNRKTLACALIAELIIIGAILVVNWSIAERGDTGEPSCSENRGSGSPPWPVRWPWRRASWSGPDWSISAQSIVAGSCGSACSSALCFRSWLRRRA